MSDQGTSSSTDSSSDISLEVSPTSGRKLDKKKKQVSFLELVTTWRFVIFNNSKVSFVTEKNQVIELPKVDEELEIPPVKEGKQEQKKQKSTSSNSRASSNGNSSEMIRR